MTTKAKRLQLRRATPTDAVNLYRLLVGDEKRAGNGGPKDEAAARIAQILDTIATGYVTVAVHSGRIVGSIGCSLGAGPAPDEFTLVGQWLTTSPSLEGTRVKARLIEQLLAFADHYKTTIEIIAAPGAPILAAIPAGFELTTVRYVREPGLKVDDAEPEPVEADGHPGPDVGAGQVPVELAGSAGTDQLG